MPDEEPPLPPPSPVPPRFGPSRLRRTLHSLRSPFRPGSPFHIGSIKRTGSSKSVASDGEITRDERTMRKRNKKQREAAAESSRSTGSSPGDDKQKKEAGGSLLKRMGSIGKKRNETPAVSASQPETSQSVESAPTPSNELVRPTPEPLSPIAVEHAVATRPFTKAAWKRNSVPEMEKPVEEPSPENALRRRVAFVSQASVGGSEDRDDDRERGGTEVGSLEEAVALARVKLAVATPPSSSQSRDNDTEEEGHSDTMPAYGDLIEPENKAGNDATTVSGCVVCSTTCAWPDRRIARHVSGRRFSVRCARAMTFEEAVDDCYLTVCECCGFSAETTVLFPVRFISR